MPDDKQLIERLRKIADFLGGSHSDHEPIVEAADTIERLEAELGQSEAKSQHEKQAADNWAAKCQKLEAQRERDAAVLGKVALVPFSAMEDIEGGVDPKTAIEDAVDAALQHAQEQVER